MKIAPATIAALAAVALISLYPHSTPAQQKPPITAEDYGEWETPGAGSLSPDGGWLAVPIRRVDGSGELQIFDLSDAQAEPLRVEDGAQPAFSSNSAWLAYQIGYSEAERERMQEQEQPIRNKMGLLDLANVGQQAPAGESREEPVAAELIEGVASFAFNETGEYLAIRSYPPEGREAADLVMRNLANGADINFGNVSGFAWQNEGTLLAMTIDSDGGAGNGVQLYDAASGWLRVLDSGDATFSGLAWREDHDDLAALRSVEDEAYDEPTHIVLAWRGLGDEASAGGGSAGAIEPLRFDHLEAEARARGFLEGMRVVEHRTPRWSDDGSKIFFGIQEWKAKPGEQEEADEAAEDETGANRAARQGEGDDPSPPDEGEGNEQGEREGRRGEEGEEEPEPADVWIWHARDERIIPMQQVAEQRDRRKNYMAVWHVDDNRFVRLGTDLDEGVSLLEGDEVATETDRKPYIFDGMFGHRWIDVYLIDVATGERKKVIERVRYFYGGSSTGSHFLYFKDDHHWTYEIARDRHSRITAELPTTFVNEEYDHPTEQKPSWGFAGWAKDDAAVLLYDRYDIWSVAPDGSAAAKITDGAGEEVRHRYVRLDPTPGFFGPPQFGGGREPQAIDPNKPIYLSLFGQWTKNYGYARLDPASASEAAAPVEAEESDRSPDLDRIESPAATSRNAPGGFSTDGPTRLVWLDKNVGRLAKAKEAEAFGYVVQDFDDSPDYFVGGADLADARQVTKTNPFQDDYAWGHSELIDYSCEFGKRVQAALFYPAGYDASSKHPMITYVYELRSQTLHSYSVPSERSSYNPAVWTSQGYFVLQPDIFYLNRRPGTSAVQCVRPAVERAVSVANIDADRVGLVGHSWGGYEAAFIPTQTDIFAAAVSGAALTNFFSMFGTIHWNQGMPESSHFETGQARMGVPYWEDMEAYVRESPVMFIPQLETPMLMAFGDEDGTVDWHQGVEMYNYARRAGKFFVMLVYPGENHSNRQRPNQIDYHHRVLDWFGHFLKGEEAKPWITEGQSVIDRKDELKRLKGGGRER